MCLPFLPSMGFLGQRLRRQKSPIIPPPNLRNPIQERAKGGRGQISSEQGFCGGSSRLFGDAHLSAPLRRCVHNIRSEHPSAEVEQALFSHPSSLFPNAPKDDGVQLVFWSGATLSQRRPKRVSELSVTGPMCKLRISFRLLS